MAELEQRNFLSFMVIHLCHHINGRISREDLITRLSALPFAALRYLPQGQLLTDIDAHLRKDPHDR